MSNKEWAFYLYQNLTSFLEEPQYWFVLTAFIYVFNYYFVAKKIAPENTLLLFLAVVGAFCFNSYGTNTIRAGLALSFVVVGMTYYENIWKSFVFFFIAYNVHHSTAIPIAAFLVANIIANQSFSIIFGLYVLY